MANAAAARVTRFLPSHRREFVSTAAEQPETRVVDVEFEFLDDGETLLARSSSSSDECDPPNELDFEVEEEEEEKDHSGSLEENRSFWDNQHQVLQAIICRTSSLESRIRHATKEALQEIQSAESVCGCGGQLPATSCRNCLMREVSRRLQNAGFNSAICKTKWTGSPDIPSGEHKFLDVIDNRRSKKGEVRVMIELNLRAEFEMARGSEEYNRLVRRLPEVFVGKVERLSNVIKIMCTGAKRCMKEKKMHMGPWRKHRYMQAKWLGSCQRNTSTNLSMGSSSGYSHKMTIMPKPRPNKASLLTVDLLDKLPNLHCTAVEVV